MYVDPGSGLMILQTFLAAVAGIVYRFRRAIFRARRKSEPVEPGLQAQADENRVA
jgi:hypothetical protein